MQKVILLKSIPLLAGATVDELVRLAGEVAEIRAAPGTFLFRQGETAEALHLVLSGRVAAVGARGVAGELAVLAQTRHPHDGLVQRAAHLLHVPAEAFFDLDLASAASRT